MSSIDLTYAQKERLSRLGLIKLGSASGYDRYLDPKTSSVYTLSPRGYVLRKTKTGSYQVNPRFMVKGNKFNTKQVKATVRFNEPGAITELTVSAVENFRRRKGLLA